MLKIRTYVIGEKPDFMEKKEINQTKLMLKKNFPNAFKFARTLTNNNNICLMQFEAIPGYGAMLYLFRDLESYRYEPFFAITSDKIIDTFIEIVNQKQDIEKIVITCVSVRSFTNPNPDSVHELKPAIITPKNLSFEKISRHLNAAWKDV